MTSNKARGTGLKLHREGLDWIEGKMFWLKGWSGIGRGCPGSGGVTIPGSAQKALACGTWGCGVVLNMAGLRWWLNSITLEAFSIPNSSVILYIYCALAVPIRLSPLQIPHSLAKPWAPAVPKGSLHWNPWNLQPDIVPISVAILFISTHLFTSIPHIPLSLLVALGWFQHAHCRHHQGDDLFIPTWRPSVTKSC